MRSQTARRFATRLFVLASILPLLAFVGLPYGTAVAGGNLEDLDPSFTNILNVRWTPAMFSPPPTPALTVKWHLRYPVSAPAGLPTQVQVLAAVQAGFDAWENLPNNMLDFTFVTTTSQGVTSSLANGNLNVMSFAETGPDPGYIAATFVSAITVDQQVCDNNESPTNNGIGFLKLTPTRNTLRVPTPVSGCVTYPAGTIADADIDFNARTTSFSFSTTNQVGEEDLQAIATHEIGHLTGLSHDPALEPTMFAFSDTLPFGEGDSARSPEQNDVAMSGHLYGTAGFGTNFGTITGNITINPGADGVSVIALRASDLLPVVGRFSLSQFMAPTDPIDGADFVAHGGGFYRLDGLPAGNYYVYMEYLDGLRDEVWGRMQNRYNDTVANSNVADGDSCCALLPAREADLAVPAGFLGFLPERTEFYNGANESGNGGNGTTPGAATDNPDEATLVTVTAGSVTPGINLAVNLDPDTGKAPDVRSNPTGVQRADITPDLANLAIVLLDDDGHDDDWVMAHFHAAELPAPPYNVLEGIWSKFGLSDKPYIGAVMLSPAGNPNLIGPPIVFNARRFVTGHDGGTTAATELFDLHDHFNVTVNDSRDVYAAVKIPESAPGITLGVEGYFTVYKDYGAPPPGGQTSTGDTLLTPDNFSSLFTFTRHDIVYRLKTETAPAMMLTSAAPATLNAGATGTVVTLTGAGFRPGAQVSFLAPTFGGPVASGVTVTNVNFVNAATLQVTVNVSPTALGGILDVEVANPGAIVPVRSRLMSVTIVDTDGDGFSDGVDCVPADNTLWAIPGVVPENSVHVTQTGPNTAHVVWSAPASPGGTSVSYDVTRGLTSVLHASGTNFGSCYLNDTVPAAFDDSDVVPSGDARTYIIAARNACGRGTFGSAARNANAGNCAP